MIAVKYQIILSWAHSYHPTLDLQGHTHTHIIIIPICPTSLVPWRGVCCLLVSIPVLMDRAVGGGWGSKHNPCVLSLWPALSSSLPPKVIQKIQILIGKVYNKFKQFPFLKVSSMLWLLAHGSTRQISILIWE